ncbi:MAG: hypothetical protein IKX51_07705 [Bacteroidales bacterium]|nr:hypothetical protein [Bacteroidales bacterium]
MKNLNVSSSSDLPAEENTFFNINAWQSRPDNSNQTRYTFALRLQDMD